VAFLSVVLWGWFSLAQSGSLARRAIPGKVQILRRQTHALHALLSVVPTKSTPEMAGPAVSRNMQPVRLVGRYQFLELLPLVQAEFGLIDWQMRTANVRAAGR
jgi:hypothetical protein